MSEKYLQDDPHQSFIRYVMSDVYALLDYLSGRAAPPIAPVPPYESQRRRNGVRAAHVDDAPAGGGSDMAGSIDDDLTDRNALLSRAMRIGRTIETSSVGAGDSAFLILARDFLNRQAAPATGSTISFTIRVVHELLGDSGRGRRATRNDYLIPDSSLDRAATALARFVRCQVRVLWLLLVLAVGLSTYVACGKLLLDTRDAVNRDTGGNISAIMAEAKQGGPTLAPIGLKDTTNEWVETVCRAASPTASLNLNCGQHHELNTRREGVHELLAGWMIVWPFKALPDETGAQWATTMIGVTGNYLLPVLYGWLGALGFVLRRLNRQLADYLLTPRELRANLIRIVLGVVTGACIGLFVNNSAGAATLTGLGGAAVTLSASGIAFLAGYGVEAVFKMMDGLIEHIFRIGDDSRSRGAAG